jgi:hypothetical protein
MTTVTNEHARRLPASAEVVGRLLDRLGSPGDPLWPSPPWVPMRLDRPLSVGADGGHGPVRYYVSRYEPGRLVEFTFHERTGLLGTHTFEVEPAGSDACELRHRLIARPVGIQQIMWPALIRSCHDTVLEHLLDNAELAVTGRGARPVVYPWRARLAIRAESGSIRTVPLPDSATLLSGAIPAADLADAYSVRVPPGTTADPQEWADRVFRDPPPTVLALLHLRNALVGMVGIERGDSSAFDTLERTEREVLLGTDAGHLDFRASVLVQPDADGTTVTVSTVAATHSAAGRAYLRVVGLVHPFVVRAMLRRAARTASWTTARRGRVTAPAVRASPVG